MVPEPVEDFHIEGPKRHTDQPKGDIEEQFKGMGKQPGRNVKDGLVPKNSSEQGIGDHG